MNPIQAQDGTQLDPSVVALSRAMRTIESGGKYDAAGKSGEYGAYQYTEPFWRGAAQKYLGNSNADVRDPVNQDKVAYYRILERKQAGMTPEQIVSEWNSGDPDAYTKNHRGVNQYGVPYDTPGHVNKVMQVYLDEKNRYMAGLGTSVAQAAGTNDLSRTAGLTPEDVSSAVQYGASFPSARTDSPLKAGLKATGNVPSSMLHFAKGIGSVIRHPIQTAKGIGNLGVGAVEKASNVVAGTNFQTPRTQTVDALGQYANARYGTSFGPQKFNIDTTFQNLQRTATNDPMGFGSDVLLAIKGGAKLADVLTGAKAGQGAQLLDYVDNIKDTTKHVLTDPEFSGNASDAIPSMKADLMTNFGPQGFNANPQILNKISALDPTKFSSVDDFAKAAKAAIGAKGLYTTAVNTGIEKVGQAGLAPFRAAGRTAKGLLTGTLGATTGEGGTTVKTALESAMQGGDARTAFKEALRGKYTPDDIVKEAQGALKNVKGARAESYTKQLAEIADDAKTYNIQPIYDAVDDQLDKFNIATGKDGLNFSRSKFALDRAAQNDISSLVDYVKGYGLKPADRTVAGIDNLKQVLGGYYSPNSDYRAFVQGVKSSIWDPSSKSGVLSEAPGYAKLAGDYADDSAFITELQKSLSLGGKAAVDTTFKKLISALKDNQPARNALVKELGEYSKGGLLPKLAGSDMSQFVPGGLTGLIEKTGGVVALVKGVSLSTILPLITVASPRIVGEFINILGLTSGQATKLFTQLGVPNAAIFVANSMKQATDAGLTNPHR